MKPQSWREEEDVDIIPDRGINAEVVGIELPCRGQNDLIACLCARPHASQIPLPPLYTALIFPNDPAYHAI